MKSVRAAVAGAQRTADAPAQPANPVPIVRKTVASTPETVSLKTIASRVGGTVENCTATTRQASSEPTDLGTR